MQTVALPLPKRPLFRQRVHDNVFKQIYRQSLIYNTCVEDPRIDRQLLQLDSESRVLVITSGGCNALDYLLDGPAAVYAVDMNPRQNSLLWLKMALIEHRPFADLFAFFGQGHHPDYQGVLQQLRGVMPGDAAAFWAQKGYFFDGLLGKRSFYFQGTTGSVAWWLNQYLRWCPGNLATLLPQLIDAPSLSEQVNLFQQIEPVLWNRFAGWIITHPLVLALLGVPQSQIRLMAAASPDGPAGYIRERVRKLCTTIPMHDNYFWRVYLTGSYTPTCCPNYLKPENQPTLRRYLPHLHPYTGSLIDFLRHYTGTISHFVLLDHQDWLAGHDPAALEQEWSLILQRAAPGSKLLWRSACGDASFLPEWVRGRLRFFPELTTPLHEQDRLAMYHSLHLAELIP